jgi:hypothetical protein
VTTNTRFCVNSPPFTTHTLRAYSVLNGGNSFVQTARIFFVMIVTYNLLAVQKYGYFSGHTKAVGGGGVVRRCWHTSSRMLANDVTTAKIAGGPPQP